MRGSIPLRMDRIKASNRSRIKSSTMLRRATLTHIPRISYRLSSETVRRRLKRKKEGSGSIRRKRRRFLKLETDSLCLKILSSK